MPPVSTFPALTVPLLTGDNRVASWTWQQKFIQWETQLNTIPTRSFGTGAPTSVGNQGDFYFDTSASPYHGYVYNAGNWERFS